MPDLLDPPGTRTGPVRRGPDEPADRHTAEPTDPPLAEAPPARPGRGGRGVYRAGEWRGATWPLVVPREAYEIDGFLAWLDSPDFPAGLKASLINDRLWLEPRMDDYAHHNLLNGAVYAALRAFGRSTGLGQAFVDGAMVVRTPGTVGREPDCGFNLFESFRSGRVRVGPRTEGGSGVIVGQADLLAECLSDGSVEKDTVELRRTYWEMGVREYWLLDGRGEELDFTLLTRPGSGEGDEQWVEVRPDADGSRVSPLLNRRVRVERETDPLGNLDWDVRLDEMEDAAA